MPTYLTPGIYMEEVSSGPRPIESVGTSTAGFAGVAPDPLAHLDQPVAITNWTRFQTEFAKDTNQSTPLARAVNGFFRNGGQRCYVLNVGDSESLAGDGRKRRGLAAFDTIDEIAIVAAPGFTGASNYELLLAHAENLGDRVALLDAPEDVPDIDRLKRVATVEAPRRRRGRDAAGAEGTEEPASGPTPAEVGLRPRESDRGFGAFYFPWIVEKDPLNPKETVTSPPSGHIAGIYASSDAKRGVQKAPGNEPIKGALDLTYRLTRAEQGELNQMGVNCLRFFPRRGLRVWGVRTLAASGSEWRYVNVRRLFNMIEESIVQSTAWIVFEPNDRTLWKNIRRDVGAYLRLLWSDGALVGATPEEAYFVQCDEETNPPEVRDNGMVVIRVGIAPSKPAEFVVFRIGQYAGGAEVTE